MPIYLFYMFLFLVIPAAFFIFRKEKTLDEKRFLLVIITSLIGGVIWDSISVHFQIWGYPSKSVLGWFLGVPLEDYIFYVTFPTIILGIYSSLPLHRKKILFSNEPKISDTIILLIVFALQIGVFLSLVFFGMNSYIKWMLFFTGFPSAFYLFRKGEKIDEINLLITLGIWLIYLLFLDPIFLLSSSYYYNDPTLLGKIWIIPIDDFLFTIFCIILTIGIYTSIPKKLLSLQFAKEK